MHKEFGTQSGASHWRVIAIVALICSIAIAAWLWISPQRVASAPSSSPALPPISIPTSKTMSEAEGRKGMAGSSASADIRQQVERLAEASRRKSPDVSQFPPADTSNDAWPVGQVETRKPAVVTPLPASTPEAPAEQVRAEPEPQPGAQTTAQEPAREEPVVSSAELDSLLEAGRADLARDRLTTPAGANALERFQAVLAHDPENVEATNGLHAIVTRYIELARRVARDGRFEKAESFLQRAERVGVKTDALLAAREELARMRGNQ